MINWGILGTGKIAQTFATDIQYTTGGKLIAVGSRSQETANSFAKKNNINKVYSTYEQLVQDPEIDVIYISTPHNLHYECTKLCLKHGKSVLCEKPMAVNSQQLEEMTTLAKSRNLFLMEAMWTYFLPSIIQAQKWIADGLIGDVQVIKADFGFRAHFNPVQRLFNPELAGGALLDIGIYPLAFSLLLAKSEVQEISVSAHIGTTGVDEFDMMHLTFKNGIKAALTCSITSQFENAGLIYGTKGYIKLPMFWQARAATVTVYDGDETQFQDDRLSHGFNFEADHVNEMLNNDKNESSIMTHARSFELCKLMDEIRDQIGLVYPFEV